MKKVLNNKNLLIIFLLAILLVNIVPVLAQEKTPFENFMDWWKTPTEDVRLLSAQIMFFLLIALILYAVSKEIPFLENSNQALRGTIAGIIAFLSVGYLTPEEVWTMLMGYGPLAVSLTSIIPLVLLVIITTQWNQRKPEYFWISEIAWIAFFVAFLIKYTGDVYQWFFNGNIPRYGGFGLLFVALTFIGSIIMILWGSKIAVIAIKWKAKALINKSEIRSDTEKAARIAELRQKMIALPEAKDVFEEEIKRLEKLDL